MPIYKLTSKSIFVMKTATAKPTMKDKTEKFDIYETLTNEICDMMEKGVCPWRQPWKSIGGTPRNYKGRPYRGANSIMLALVCMVNEWENPIFLTFKQVQECGGTVKKGSKSCMVTFAKIFVPEEYISCPELCPSDKKKFMLRYYRVFNIEQCENVDLPAWGKETDNENNPIETCELIVANMPKRPEIKHTGGKAYYAPSLDKVVMPAKKTFDNSESYYATLFHELSHSTGHESRLARPDAFKNGFGSDPYAFEELVAELSSCFLCAHAEIVDTTKEQSASYIKGWLKKFKDDKKFFFRAAALAQKSCDFIIGKTFDEEKED